MPDEGATAWDDVVLGRVEVANETIEDVVIVRSDGRPTYNFASPIEDALDGITHVIRGPDHVSNTPKQINLLRALGAEIPVYAHVPNVNGGDNRKLSKRHGAVTVEEFRANGYLPEALVNFLALLGWSYDDKTTIMSRDELVERFSLDRVGSSPATFDYEKLDWMNGVYIRALPPDEFADAARRPTCASAGSTGTRSCVRRAAPLVQEKIETLGRFPEFARFLFEPVEAVDGFDRAGPDDARRRGPLARRGRAVRGRADRAGAAGGRGRARPQAEAGVSADPGRGHRVDGLAGAVREPRAARTRDLARADQTRGWRSGLGGASGSSARWNVCQERRRKRGLGRGSSCEARVAGPGTAGQTPASFLISKE